jgi:hypothetical protein
LSVVEQWWKALLARLPCVLCARFVASGVPPSLHHIATGSGVRSTFALCPLCEPHHQGPAGLHGMSPRAFVALYRPPGETEYGLLVWMIEDLAAWLRHRVPQLGRR